MIKGSSVRETFKVTGRLGDRVRDIREWREELRSEVKIWFSLLEKFFFPTIPIAHWHCKLHIAPLQKVVSPAGAMSRGDGAPRGGSQAS